MEECNEAESRKNFSTGINLERAISQRHPLRVHAGKAGRLPIYVTNGPHIRQSWINPNLISDNIHLESGATSIVLPEGRTIHVTDGPVKRVRNNAHASHGTLSYG